MTLKITTDQIVKTRKNLQKANKKRGEILNKDKIRNKIHMWEVVQSKTNRNNIDPNHLSKENKNMSTKNKIK